MHMLYTQSICVNMAKTLDITLQHMHRLVSTCTGMMEYSFTIILGNYIYKDGWDAKLSTALYVNNQLGTIAILVQ